MRCGLRGEECTRCVVCAMEVVGGLGDRQGVGPEMGGAGLWVWGLSPCAGQHRPCVAAVLAVAPLAVAVLCDSSTDPLGAPSTAVLFSSETRRPGER